MRAAAFFLIAFLAVPLARGQAEAVVTAKLERGTIAALVMRIEGHKAFKHGIALFPGHPGILKLRETWEIMDPEAIGIPRGTQLVLGKLSGRHAFRARLLELGHEPDEPRLEAAFARFKRLADRKVAMTDEDLVALLDHPADRRAEGRAS